MRALAEASLEAEGDSQIIVVDIGGTSVKFGALRGGRISDVQRLLPTASIRSSNPVERLGLMIEEYARSVGLNQYDAVLTIPGFIDRDFDRVLYTPNVPELEGIRLASELSARLSQRVILERDAVLLLHGELQAGAAQSCDHVLGIFFGTGVGAAFISGHQPFRGGGWALEIGHMPFPSTKPARILEDIASGRSLAVIAQEAGCSVSEVFLVAQQLPELKSRLDQFVTDQAIAIGAAVAFFSPHTVVLGGGVVEMDGYPQEALLYELRARLSPQRFSNPDIKWATLGWRSALHGARVAVQSRLVALPAQGAASA